MRQCKTHVHVMVLYNFEVKGKGIQRIKEHSREWLVFVCNDSFYPFILILISPIHVHILMEFSWHIAICDVSQKPSRIWWYLRHVKCALNWLKRSYKSCIRSDDTWLDSWTRSLNIRRKVSRKMSDTLGSIMAITYSESRNVSNFPEFISPYCPEIQSSDQKFVELRNTEHKCCMQSRHVSDAWLCSEAT